MSLSFEGFDLHITIIVAHPIWLTVTMLIFITVIILYVLYVTTHKVKKAISKWVKAVIQLGTGFRTFAHLFLKLSWRTLSKLFKLLKNVLKKFW